MNLDNSDKHCVCIYIDQFNSEPYVIKFYNDISIQDKEYILREAIENILLHQNDKTYNIWDVDHALPIDIYSQQLHNCQTFLIAKKYEQKKEKKHAMKDEFDSVKIIMPINKSLQVKSKIPKFRENSIIQSLGPKADIAKRENSQICSTNFSYKKYKNKAKKVNSIHDENDTNPIFSEENQYGFEYSALNPSKHLINQNIIDYYIPEKDLSQTLFEKDASIRLKHRYNSGKLASRNSIATIENFQLGSPQKNQRVINYDKIWTNLDNDIGVVPIDGNDPTIWSTKTNFQIYTYLEKAMNSNYNPRIPPPIYLPYSILSKLRPSDKKFIFKGIEIASSGELICTDKEILGKQKGIVTEVIGKLAKSISEGRGIIGISLPVRIFEPRSMIERIIDWWSFMPAFLLPAAYEQNPIERMKYIISFAISGLYVSANQLKPFTPLLGETYQGFFPGYDIGIFCEHTNHHPPITNFFVCHKEFKFYGRYEFYANLEANTLTLLQVGPNYCEFKDGEKIVFYWPFLKVYGMLFGERKLKWIGVLKFIDEKNQLKGIIKMDNGQKKGIFSKHRSDIFSGQIYKYKQIKDFDNKKKAKRDQYKEDEKMKDMHQCISKINGSWLEKLDIDDKEFWNINKYFPCRPQPVKNSLPSDCRYREDLLWVKYNNLVYAEEWKLKLEERQRYERKLRQNNNRQKNN